MKTTKKIASVLFVGFALQQIALSQTTNVLDMGGPPTTGDNSQPVILTTTEATNATPATSAAAVTMAATNGNTMAPATGETAAAGTNQVTMTNEVAAASSDTNPPPTPPIVFQDVPITTAIEALARQANINYLMDPKIGYGQPDERGQLRAEPSISVRWENVTYQQALVALLDNYGLQMVENPKTKIVKITVKDPAAPPSLVTRVIQLKYASTTNITAAITSSLSDKRSRVLPDTRTSQLIVVATDNEQSSIDILIAQLDKPTKQVLIETKIVELSSNPTTKKGIDWSGTLDAQNFAIGNNVSQAGRYSRTVAITDTNLLAFGVSPLLTSYGPPLPLTSPRLLLDTDRGLNPSKGFLDADGVKAVLSFLNASSEAQVVSTPRVVTLDNETATIEVTRAFPVFNTTAGTQGSPGGSQVTYSNLGTILEVTPRISANDYIWLKVQPTVSSFFGTVTKTVGGLVNQADEFDIRKIDTQVLIPNSHTLVMGGLVKDNPNAQFTKVPILGDIPVIGLAFRHESKSLEKDNLLLFITPTIVKESDFKATTSTFLDSEPRTMKDPMNPKSWYDGAAPRGDWSNPLPSTVK